MAKRKNNRILWILLGAVVVLVGAAAVFGKKQETGIKIATEKVSSRSITEMVNASGRIYPEFEVKISPDVSGEIVDLLVEEGDSVTVGQLLLKIRPDIYQATLERLEATVNSSKAQLANAQSNILQVKAQQVQMEAQLENAQRVHNRNLQLKKDGVISDSDVESSETSLKTAQANLSSTMANLESAKQSAEAARFNLASSQASVKEARDNLARTSTYAPASGIVSLLNVEKGERVVGTAQMTGTEILRIANMNTMEVQVDVSENDVLRVSMGDEANIEVDAHLGTLFTGKVTEIANSAQTVVSQTSTDQVTNFTVTIRLDPSSYKHLVTKRNPFPFRPGMSATVDIKTKIVEDVLSVPVIAITTREDEDAKDKAPKEVVFVYTNDTARLREVTYGIQDDEYIEIIKGLKKGEEVVVEPYDAIDRKLEDGSKVVKKTKDELFGRKKKDKK